MLGRVEGQDHVLVTRVMAGDEGAIAQLFDQYAPFVYGLACRLTGNASLAEDVVQEVFTTVWCHPERFDGSRGSLRTFLGLLTQGRALDAARSDARRAARECRHHDLEPQNAGQCYDAMETATIVDLVRQAIAQLPPDQREAVELVYLEGHTQRELAALLGIPEGTAKSRLRLAQSKLGKWLAPHVLEMA
jgi:RNA polymerase sigma-70 factor (ECF subfamily)